ncbi:Transmembrane emp24 domain-containing protein 3 [Cichlidogyrus casuarinus]|uniref:Transmembrane emp24 domain-containing protein 3 n=1 Tax=Cichlidogyrus casuarinus TaxID=1844966 RepID=A0ABD2PSY5_9PLAT
MLNTQLVFASFLLLAMKTLAFPKRLIFELPDGEQFCLYEDLTSSKAYHFQFRVLRGGANDINSAVRDPKDKIFKEFLRVSHEQYEFTPKEDGPHSFCFDNTFSSVSHKLVFFELRDKDFDTLEEEGGVTPHPTVETALETSAENIHKHLSLSEDIQTDLRSKERSDRYILFDLHMRVTFWSTVTTIVIFITAIGQVTLVKSLFPDRSKSVHSYARS